MTYSRTNEIASGSQIEKNLTDNERFKRGAKSAIGLASTALGGGAILSSTLGSRILPFLNEYITPDMAMKGINKISPDIGNFLKNGLKNGLALKSGLDFLKDKLSPQSIKQKDPVELISGYSPELSQFIQRHILNGRTPTEAAALAKLPGRHDKAVKAIEKDTKENFVDLIARLFGSQTSQEDPKEMKRQQNLQQFNQQQQPNMQGTINKISGGQQTPNSAQGQLLARQQGKGQPGQGDADLIAAMEKILKM